MLWFAACASLVGLEELDTLPPSFPLTIEGQIGKITRPHEGGQIALDMVFEAEPEARRAFAALRAQAEARGFTQAREPVVDRPDQRGRRPRKSERVVLARPEGGAITLDCCPARADRRRLILVKWEEEH